MSDLGATLFLGAGVLGFLGLLAWLFWPGRKRKLDRQARIPLEDDPVEPRE